MLICYCCMHTINSCPPKKKVITSYPSCMQFTTHFTGRISGIFLFYAYLLHQCTQLNGYCTYFYPSVVSNGFKKGILSVTCMSITAFENLGFFCVYLIDVVCLLYKKRPPFCLEFYIQHVPFR